MGGHPRAKQLAGPIHKWAAEHVNPKHLVQDARVAKVGLVTDQHISVLLGMPEAPSQAFASAAAAAVSAFRLSFGPIKCFPPETKVLPDGSMHTYCVMYVEVLQHADNPGLTRLQHLLGRMCMPASEPPLPWHHHIYNPHATIGFLDLDAAPEAAAHYTGLAFLDGDARSMLVDRVVFQKFQDKAFAPITAALRTRD